MYDKMYIDTVNESMYNKLMNDTFIEKQNELNGYISEINTITERYTKQTIDKEYYTKRLRAIKYLINKVHNHPAIEWAKEQC